MFQRVQLIGRVGSDPEMRYTPDGTPVTNFSVATSQRISKDKTPNCPQGWKESYNGKHWELTTWFRVTAWRQLAEVVNQYVHKGDPIFVEGEMAGEASDGALNPRVWTGNDGVARASYELTGRTVKFLGGNGDGGSSNQTPPPQEDELPF
jgi:single-strand DNA-binding protein